MLPGGSFAAADKENAAAAAGAAVDEVGGNLHMDSWSPNSPENDLERRLKLRVLGHRRNEGAPHASLLEDNREWHWALELHLRAGKWAGVVMEPAEDMTEFGG